MKSNTRVDTVARRVLLVLVLVAGVPARDARAQARSAIVRFPVVRTSVAAAARSEPARSPARAPVDSAATESSGALARRVFIGMGGGALFGLLYAQYAEGIGEGHMGGQQRANIVLGWAVMGAVLGIIVGGAGT